MINKLSYIKYVKENHEDEEVKDITIYKNKKIEEELNDSMSNMINYFEKMKVLLEEMRVKFINELDLIKKLLNEYQLTTIKKNKTSNLLFFNKKHFIIEIIKEIKEKNKVIEEIIQIYSEYLIKLKKDTNSLKEKKQEIYKNEEKDVEIRYRENFILKQTNEFNILFEIYQEKLTIFKEFIKIYNNNNRFHIYYNNNNRGDEEQEEEKSKKEIDNRMMLQKQKNHFNEIENEHKKLKISTLSTIYEEVKETQEDLLKLENELIQLEKLYISINELLNEQEDFLDNIQNNIGKTMNYIEIANKNLKTGNSLLYHCNIS